MQATTGSAVSSIRGIVRVVDEMDSIAGTIAAAVEEQRAATEEIARNVSHAATGTQQVTVTIGSVGEAARLSGQSASAALDAARDLARQGVVLRGTVDRVVAEIRAGA
jgi:methyl-accepting chemotaxis protein